MKSKKISFIDTFKKISPALFEENKKIPFIYTFRKISLVFSVSFGVGLAYLLASFLLSVAPQNEVTQVTLPQDKEVQQFAWLAISWVLNNERLQVSLVLLALSLPTLFLL